VAINTNGEVNAGGTSAGKLKIVAFNKPAMLRQAGSSTYAGDAAEPRPAAAFSVHQGYVEASNVDPVSELVRMMSTFRDYQACARSLRSIEDSANSLYSWARS
jgi:flagellar basal-body rod protein FlgG